MVDSWFNKSLKPTQRVGVVVILLVRSSWRYFHDEPAAYDRIAESCDDINDLAIVNIGYAIERIEHGLDRVIEIDPLSHWPASLRDAWLKHNRYGDRIIRDADPCPDCGPCRGAFPCGHLWRLVHPPRARRAP